MGAVIRVSFLLVSARCTAATVEQTIRRCHKHPTYPLAALALVPI